jgi:hypothetical protein
MAGSDEDLGRSRRPGAEDRGWSSTGWILGGWTIERSGDAVCSLYYAHGDDRRSRPFWDFAFVMELFLDEIWDLSLWGALCIKC